MGSREKIYSILRSGGLTRAGALGLMGNWDCESNLEAGRVQGDFNPFRTGSKLYVSRVTSGAISRDQFMKDAKGFGLAQWTYFARKGMLYDFWKESGEALDSSEMQTRFALYELATGGEYGELYHVLKTSDDLLNCVTKVCTVYERPAVNNIDARYSAAQKLAQQIGEDIPVVNADPVEEPSADGGATASDERPVSEFWPPRGYFGGSEDPGLCKGMKGRDVELLSIFLKVRGYNINYATDVFSDLVEECLIQFQKDQGLSADGICGKNSWHALLTA